MAIDKLVDSTILDAAQQYTANRIRAKTGGSASIPFDMTPSNPKGFGDAVDAIQTGITPSGSVEITANGTYDVTDKASAVVNVPSGGITPSGTKQISITANGTTTEDVTNYENAEITVNVPTQAAVFTGDDFNERYKSSEDFVSTTKTSWSGINFGAGFAARSIRLMAASGEWTQYSLQNLLSGNGKVQYFVAPLLSACSNSMLKATAMLGVDVGASSIFPSAFSGCSNLAVLVLRKTDAVCTLANINAFTNTPFASGKAGGTLYVPQALIADYQAATNWATILGYSTNSIQAIEGSIYETQYVDGTMIAA